MGCGDRYPVTAEGRVVAGALMVAGIALLGVVTASIASWFVESVRANDRETERVEAQLAQVLAELQAVRGRLDPRDARDRDLQAAEPR